MYALNTKPLPDVSFAQVWLVSPNGTTLERNDGHVVSCNPPHGDLQTRPNGTAGIYEQVVVDGGTATYMPRPGEVYVFAIRRVPNA
jgi:hypothetical protein